MDKGQITLLHSNALLASALERAIANDERLVTVPWPATAADLPFLLENSPPQVVVLEGGGTLSVPPRRIAEWVKMTRPSVKVVVVVDHWTEEMLLDVLEAGADAALSYQAGVEQLSAAIHGVRCGESYLSPDLTRLLFDWMQRRPLRQRQRQHLASTLTSQQLQILAALAEGKRDREIAEKMFLSPKTVRNNVSIILRRLGVRDRGEAAIYAAAAGLTDSRETEHLLLRT